MKQQFIVMQEISIDIGEGDNGIESHYIMGVYESKEKANQAIATFKRKQDIKKIRAEYKKEYPDLSTEVNVDYIVYELKDTPLNTFEGVVNYNL